MLGENILAKRETTHKTTVHIGKPNRRIYAMNLIARITFYDIEACGYFRRGKEGSLFGDAASCLDQLLQWAKSTGLVLRDTCTYESEERTGCLRTFCFDMVRSSTNTDYLLTTWNEIPSFEGKTATVNGSQRVGTADVELSDLPADGIPGYPTYFWFLPSENRFATVTFNAVLNGHQNLAHYMNGFLRTFSRHVCKSANDLGEIKVTGYRKSEHDTPARLYPRFESALCYNRAEIEYIRSNRQSISKYIRKVKIEPNIQRDVGFIRKLFEHATGINQNKRVPRPLKIRYEAEATPDAAELNAMIKEWRTRTPTRWDDVGFKITGDSRGIRWLSHSLARDDFELEIDCPANPTVIPAEALLTAIESQRDSMRTLVKDA